MVDKKLTWFFSSHSMVTQWSFSSLSIVFVEVDKV
jgi:hypothetical protein